MEGGRGLGIMLTSASADYQTLVAQGSEIKVQSLVQLSNKILRRFTHGDCFSDGLSACDPGF